MQQFMLTFQGHMPPPEILAAVERGKVASFCLFKGINIESASQLRELCDSLQAAAQRGGQPPVLIGIDQEGGQLMAVLGETTKLAGNMALGASRSPLLAEQAGRVLGRELLAMGANLNFAPSVDVNINPANPVIGTRSFGDDPHLVAELGAALIRGMQAEGVIATAKHFPGHGDTSSDTHHSAAQIDFDRARLDAVEFPPFRAAIQAGVGAIMTAHLVVNALDPHRPATISPIILKDLLRKEMGFEGLIITDAMDMYGVAHLGRHESIGQALEAGADLILLGHLPDQLDLLNEFEANPESLTRIRAAQNRLRGQSLAPEIIGSAEHQAIARRIAEESITLVRHSPAQFPLQLHPETKLVVIEPIPANLTPADTSASSAIHLGKKISERHSATKHYLYPLNPSAEEVAALLEQTQDADQIIIGTINANEGEGHLIRALCQRGQKPILLALRMPYDSQLFPEVETSLCSYSIHPPSIEAAIKVLFGELEAKGILPVK